MLDTSGELDRCFTTQLLNLFQSRTPTLFYNPDPIDIRWPKAGKETFGDPVREASILEVNVVVNSATRLVVEVLRHDSSSYSPKISL